jgi:hypothetical protein
VIEVTLPALTEGASQSWHALLDLSERVPDHWCLVGGQMVLLHCLERGAAPTRPTDGGDAVVDIRARQTILRDATAALVAIGFVADGISAEGHQHRWVRGAAKIDVLLPDGVGETASRATGVSGGTTLQAPGTTQALNRAEVITVVHGGRRGTIRRPDLLGALVGKAAALTIPVDPWRDRHLVDLANLAAIVGRTDLVALTSKDRTRLRNALEVIDRRSDLVNPIDGAQAGLARIGVAVG